MTHQSNLSRRRFLLKSGALGCSLAASPLLTPVSLAATPGDNRLVVILLRGAMDGLDVVRPVGDPEYGWLRPGLSGGANPLPLSNFFALHPALKDLHPLWAKGELGFAHAVSTPYRDKRSHFDGQDLLEAGIGPGGSIRDGWLNRLVQTLPNAGLRTAFAVGREDLLILHGDAPVSGWAPDTVLTLSPQSRLLLERMYGDAPMFSTSIRQAADLAETLDAGGPVEGYEDVLQATMQSMQSAGKGNGVEKIAAFTAQRLREETRIASFSITGWDTHNNQKNTLSRALTDLQRAILTLRDGLGPVWEKTAILAVTEFGRTARENGSGGTDHGTGGAMLMSGGALKGGKVFGQWPGLGDGDLYQGRDLMPTGDVRAYAAAALAGMFGSSRASLRSDIFPGLDTGNLPNIVL